MERIAPIIERYISQFDYQEPEMFLNNTINLYDKLDTIKAELD